MPTTLVTGGASFMGWHLAADQLALGHGPSRLGD